MGCLSLAIGTNCVAAPPGEAVLPIRPDTVMVASAAIVHIGRVIHTDTSTTYPLVAVISAGVTVQVIVHEVNALTLTAGLTFRTSVPATTAVTRTRQNIDAGYDPRLRHTAMVSWLTVGADTCPADAGTKEIIPLTDIPTASAVGAVGYGINTHTITTDLCIAAPVEG